MRRLAFCEYCMSENEYKIHKRQKISILRDEEIIYTAKDATCNKCGNEIFISDVNDYNLGALYEGYRKNNNIIQVSEIKHILTKYCINSEALSLLLGWENKTIKRYMDGDMPTKTNSTTLRKIYDSTNYYSIILQTNKKRIKVIDYNKSRQAVNTILSRDDTEEKIDAVIKYILIRCEDFTPSALQNLLYYVQAFYNVFADKFIFEEEFEASIDGPIFSSVYDRYKKYGFDEVNRYILANKKLKLEDNERNIVESVIKFYGCYSGKILKKMTCNEAPWMLCRAKTTSLDELDSNKIIEKNLIEEYFMGIKVKYNMINLLDIQKYSTDLFGKISM